MEHINKYFYRLEIVLSLLFLFLLVGCNNTQSNENVLVHSQDDIQLINNIDEITTDEVLERTTEINANNTAIGYEGEWHRTDVASYQCAKIRISNWKEGGSFDVTLDVVYFPYNGTIEGTATFINEDRAVLYDENVEKFLQDNEGDHGIYFQFLEDSIIITHDSYVRLWFGGGGIATAEGTYIQEEPEYTNCTDVGDIFTEKELEVIQEYLGDSYESLFENIIELGEITEYTIDNGRFWEAYRPPYKSEWCNILIYNDGRIYIEGCSCSGTKEFYTNSGDTEMPDIELLK